MSLEPNSISHLNKWVNKMINKNNMMGIIALVFMVLISAVPTFAAPLSSTQTVNVSVQQTIAISAQWNNGGNNSTITLGPLAADGLVNTFSGKESVSSASNDYIDVWTKLATPTFTGAGTNPGANPFAASCFQFSGMNVTAATPYSNANSYQIIGNNTGKVVSMGSTIDYPVTFYLTIPIGTGAGNYSNTVYFSAIAHNGGTPPSGAPYP